jgi:hypothetical protein
MLESLAEVRDQLVGKVVGRLTPARSTDHRKAQLEAEAAAAARTQAKSERAELVLGAATAPSRAATATAMTPGARSANRVPG